MILTYAFLDYCTTSIDWLYDYRSLFTIVLPVMLFALIRYIKVTPQAAGIRETPLAHQD